LEIRDYLAAVAIDVNESRHDKKQGRQEYSGGDENRVAAGGHGEVEIEVPSRICWLRSEATKIIR
jgi:hypothetical protein